MGEALISGDTFELEGRVFFCGEDLRGEPFLLAGAGLGSRDGLSSGGDFLSEVSFPGLEGWGDAMGEVSLGSPTGLGTGTGLYLGWGGPLEPFCLGDFLLEEELLGLEGFSAGATFSPGETALLEPGAGMGRGPGDSSEGREKGGVFF